MTYFLVRIHFRLRDKLPTTPLVLAAVDALKYYPLGLMVVWIPTFSVAYLYSEGIVPFPIYAFFLLLGTQSGSFMAVIFFCKSHEARWRWRDLIGLRTVAKPLDFGEMKEYVEVGPVGPSQRYGSVIESTYSSSLVSSLILDGEGDADYSFSSNTGNSPAIHNFVNSDSAAEYPPLQSRA